MEGRISEDIVPFMQNNALTLPINIPPHVIANFAIQSGLRSGDAESLSRELEKFLWLCANTSRRLAPSPAIDGIWHDFILHTRDYEAFCLQNFGRFIHHVPQRGTNQGLRTCYLATIDALCQAFGTVNEVVWPHSETYLKEVCDSGCKSCNDD